MAINEVVLELKNLPLQLPSQTYTRETLEIELAEQLNFLINHNFSLLISILYRLDISESKLTKLLKSAGEKTAGEIIASLIVDRQLQKIAFRRLFKKGDTSIPDEDRW